MAAPFAAVVMDARTGEVLHATNHDTRLHPASLTKMMTLYVAFEAIRNGEIRLDTMVRVSRRAASEPPSRLGLREGQRIALRHLIRAAALRSGNDAATAIAEAVSGSVEAFAARMNRTAAAIGMSRTRFRNAHGLTEAGHMSTARDMTILGRQLYFDFPEYYGIFARRSEDAGIAHVSNTNRRFLDGYRGADGIKTGFTRAAGYNLTAMAERNGVRILVTVFGGRSVQHRHDQIVALMDRGFREAPRRASIRRPARPEYGRAAPTRTAEARSGQAPGPGAQAGGRAAGRVIRLQTAPARSPFPRARPGPGEAPSDALLAAVQSGVETALAELAAPGADTGDPDLPDAPPGPRAGANARTPPARSPVPPARPVVAVAATPEAAPPAPADDVAAAVAAGFTVIAPEVLAAVTGATAPAAPEAAAGAIAVAAPALRPEARPEPPAEIATRLVHAATSDPAEPDPDAPATDTAETAAAAAAAPAIAPPPARPAAVLRIAAAAARPDSGEPVQPPADAVAASDPVAAEPLQLVDGHLVIPGLPPIPVNPAPPATGAAPRLAATDPANAPAPAPTAAPTLAQGPDPAAPPTLVVTDDGQLLWRDADFLQALDEIAAQVEASRGIVLTAGGGPDPLPAPEPVMPEIVVRVSSSGGQYWGVDLGRFASRFDAERTLLRVALAESATLGAGVRRVVAGDGGGFRAMVLSLTENQAGRACLRLQTMAQGCTVVPP